VRFLTDSAGAVTDTYTYDAFGNLIERTGSTPNDYLYSGEQFDPNIGFYYLRARYLNPQSGRFQTMDSYEGEVFEPLSLHKYTYAHLNPVDNTDPSGHMVIQERIGVLVIIGIIAAIAILPMLAQITSNITETIKELRKGAYIYRLGAYRRQTVALRREIDWQTGLSFNFAQPTSPHVKIRVVNLLAIGFIVKPDGGTEVTNVRDGKPIPGGGTFGPGHASVYLSDMGRWDKWYEEEQSNVGVPGDQQKFSSETENIWAITEQGP